MSGPYERLKEDIPKWKNMGNKAPDNKVHDTEGKNPKHPQEPDSKKPGGGKLDKNANIIQAMGGVQKIGEGIAEQDPTKIIRGSVDATGGTAGAMKPSPAGKLFGITAVSGAAIDAVEGYQKVKEQGGSNFKATAVGGKKAYDGAMDLGIRVGSFGLAGRETVTELDSMTNAVAKGDWQAALGHFHNASKSTSVGQIATGLPALGKEVTAAYRALEDLSKTHDDYKASASHKHVSTALNMAAQGLKGEESLAKAFSSLLK